MLDLFIHQSAVSYMREELGYNYQWKGIVAKIMALGNGEIHTRNLYYSQSQKKSYLNANIIVINNAFHYKIGLKNWQGNRRCCNLDPYV